MIIKEHPVKVRYQLIIVSLSILLLASCVSNKDPYANMSEAQIFQSGQMALQKHHFSTAVAAYEAQEAKYPYGLYAHQEQLNIIYAYYKNGDYPSAEAAAQRYIHLNPQGQYVDYAYYMKAMSAFARDRGLLENYFPIDPALHNLAPMIEAFNEFSRVVKEFPSSPYVNDARLHMVYIRNAIARNNYKAAKYYYSRHAYVAALNRARAIVFKFQGAPTVPDALVIMYQCYKKLSLYQDAQATLKVLKLNYPEKLKKLKIKT